MARNATHWLKASLLPLLIMGQSFISYLVDNSYPLISPEVGIGLCAIGVIALLISSLAVSPWRASYEVALAALIAIFLVMEFEDLAAIGKYGLIGLALGIFYACLKLKERIHPVATVVFATLLASSIVPLLWSKRLDTIHRADTKAVTPGNPRPRIIHLILDEHIGLEGIPNTGAGMAIKERLTRFYRKYDFLVYAGAYSHYFWTSSSIPNVLNFASAARDDAFTTGGSVHPKLITNKYFGILLDRGYTITAVRTDYLDVCADKHSAPQRCILYGSHALGAIADLRDLSAFQKEELIVSGYLEHSRLYRNGVRKIYQSIQPKLASHGFPLPSWTWLSYWEQNPYWVSSIDAMSVVDSLWGEILRAPSGSVVFAHVMLPHFPYLFKEDCSISPIGQWSGRELGFLFDERYAGDGNRDIRQRREDRYDRYFQQLQCLYVQLDRLFVMMKGANIFDDSIIILHGDHGSRNVLHEPITENASVLTEDDYKDAFSTLFAIRVPGKPGGYDLSVHPLEELLAQSLQVPRELQSRNRTAKFENFVYLRRKDAKDGEDMLEVPYLPYYKSGSR